MKVRKLDRQREYMRSLTERINQINAWRNEAMKEAVTPEQRAKIEAQALEWRERVERHAP